MSETTTPKGITAHIYRDSQGIDCSRRGISAQVTEVTVIGPGLDPVFPAHEDRPAVQLVAREGLDSVTFHAVPVTPEGEPAPWFMFGGTFIFSSDSRFRRVAGHYGAVPLHDRVE